MWNGKSHTFPAGKINQGETGIEAAARETYEETGFDPHCQFGRALEKKNNQMGKFAPPSQLMHLERDLMRAAGRTLTLDDVSKAFDLESSFSASHSDQTSGITTVSRGDRLGRAGPCGVWRRPTVDVGGA